MLAHLPPRLAERARALNHRPPPRGDGVVCWVRVSLRPDDNPAIDAAAYLALALGVPLLIYQALGERYPWANDRIHTFILEGARDLAEALEARGVRYALHVERPGHRGPVLDALAARASAFVVDEYPVSPWRELTRRFADRAPCPVVAVDASCVVPMLLLKRFDRAFAFRAAHAPLVAPRIDPPEPPPTVAAWSADLPFEPVPIATTDLPALVATCAIDHAIAPVPHTRGGWRAAERRWTDFLASGLRTYAGARNDALRPQAVSRMSAYLHFGMISARKLVAATHALGGDDAEKYRDQLLTWRELAWGWCFRSRAHDERALPDWAQETWAAHGSDPRTRKSDLELERGESGDALWDAAQASLQIHGELHNNIRMTWGKAIAGWSSDLPEAVRRAIDLNHRYALDGRDPASYGGILWCFGLFDRPHPPDRPISGTIRPRPTHEHARRLKPAHYGSLTRRPALAYPPRVAIVGAGPAGATAARVLADHGLHPAVFDKGRGPGGRTSTRRDGLRCWDHGAPGLADTDLRLVKMLAEGGILTTFPDAPLHHALRPPAAMSDLVRWLLRGIDVRCGAPVTGLTPTGLEVGGAILDFDHVIVAVPAPQAMPLLSQTAPDLAAAAAAARYTPAWVLIASGDQPLELASLNALPEGSQWRLQRDSTAAVIELGASASGDDEPAAVVAQWRDPIAAALGANLTTLVAHHWRYARVEIGHPGLYVSERVSACGDWTTDVAGVAGAMAAGVATAGALLGRWGVQAGGPPSANSANDASADGKLN